MNIRYMSDLHLEWGTFLPKKMEMDHLSTLILAGDIHVGCQAVPFLELMCDRFKYVIYIFGNHEFYHHSIPEIREQFFELRKWEKLPANLHILDNKSVTLDGIRFIGSTLWTDIAHDPFIIRIAGRYMRDFRVISKGRDNLIKFTPQDSMAQHEMAIVFLEKELKKNIPNTVVVTHHLPSYACVAPRWRSNEMNPLFASELYWMIEKYKPEYWIHGHTHDTIHEVLDETIIMCNPKGYGGENEYDFNQEAMFEI